jgi:enoyl-CoA hydratase
MKLQFGQIDVTIENDVFLMEVGGLDGETHAGLAKAFHAAHESDARVMVLTGKDKTFFGPHKYDFDWVKKQRDYRYMLGCIKVAEDIIENQLNIEIPIIAKVYAPGAHSLGASLALACDFVIASEDATFSDPHCNLFGVPPGDGGALLWPARIGIARAKEALLTGRIYSAKEAVEIGLITRMVPADKLDDEVDELVNTLLSQPQLGLQITKKWLNQYLYHDWIVVGKGTLAAQALVCASDEFIDAVDKFAEQVEKERGDR